MRQIAPIVATFLAGAASCKFSELPQLGEGDGGVDSAAVTCVDTGPDAPDPTCPADRPLCVDGMCGGQCVSDADCAGRPPTESVCHVASGQCVSCNEDDRQAQPGSDDDCPSATSAVCDSVTHTCRACQISSECISGICDAGRCVPANEIVFMSSNGVDGTNDCSDASSGMGCRTLTYALGKVSSTRKYIRLEPSAIPYLADATMGGAEVRGLDIHVVGYGAALRRMGVGNIIELRDNSSVVIEGLSLEYAESGSGIFCSSAALELRNALVRNNGLFGIEGINCAALVLRSTVTANRDGGVVLVNGVFHIVNNFVFNNGNITTGIYGGISVQTGTAGNVLEFNTIVLNATQPGAVDGISCTNSGLVARNNIVVGLVGRPHTNSGTNCVHRYSLFTPDGAPTGEGNMVVPDLGSYAFAGASDLHILAGSVAAGKAQSTPLAGESLFDIDGAPRTPGGATVDVGADEIP